MLKLFIAVGATWEDLVTKVLLEYQLAEYKFSSTSPQRASLQLLQLRLETSTRNHSQRMLAFALIVLAIQLAPSEPMPMAASTGRCTSSVEDCICCEYGPAMSCDGRSDGYDAVFETDFSQTHSAMIGGRRAQAVPDETSLLLYREIDDENLEEVTCWEHQQTYRGTDEHACIYILALSGGCAR